MNLKTLADNELLDETQRLVKEERELLSKILHHLREIDRRKLYSSQGFKSLFDYATKGLGYSEDQAYRRVQAMRLLKELPEIEEKINLGSLSLTHLSLAQSLFKREEKAGERPFSKEDKITILEKFENTTKREAERVTLSFSSRSIIQEERIKMHSDNNVEFKFTGKRELLDKIEKLKALLSNKYPNLSLAELLDKLCDLGIESWDKSLPAPARVTARQELSKAQIRRDVWQRDQGRCQICKSIYFLEIDHRLPRSLGGNDTVDNLRLLCRSCNQRQAIKILGQNKMDAYLDS